MGSVFYMRKGLIHEKPFVPDPNTLLLLHGESIEDSSMYRVPLSNNGVSVSANQSKFGRKSLFFNGSSTLLFPNTTIVFGSAPFTLDWWEYSTADTNGNRFSTLVDNGSSLGISVGYAGTDLYANRNGGGAWNMISAKGAFNVQKDGWVHWALVRAGDTFTTYRNGKRFWQKNVASKAEISVNSDSRMGLGAHGRSNMQYWTGYIDEFRISNVARWTSNFTPPTEPYPG